MRYLSRWIVNGKIFNHSQGIVISTESSTIPFSRQLSERIVISTESSTIPFSYQLSVKEISDSPKFSF